MMKDIAKNWSELLLCAESFNLDMEKFAELKGTFDSAPAELRDRAFNGIFKPFPMNEVTTAFSGKELYQFLLLCISANYFTMKSFYEENGYGETMFQEVASDFHNWPPTLYVELGNVYGLNARLFSWARACLNGGVKQCGRLQFNDVGTFSPEFSFYKKADGSLEMRPFGQKDNPPDPALSYMDKVLSLHIPAIGPLDRAACVKSIHAIAEFSRKFHPDYDFKAVVCYSWILDSQFKKLLRSDANILQFQDLGHNYTLPNREQTNEVLWRLFGAAGKTDPLEKLVCKTSMQKKAVEFLQNGGHFQEGGLIILKEELDDLK